MDHNAQRHADVVSPLGIGQPLLPARRDADAAPQEAPRSGVRICRASSSIGGSGGLSGGAARPSGKVS